MQVGIIIGIAIVCAGIISILARRTLSRVIIRLIRLCYGQAIADIYEPDGVKGVTIAGVGIIFFGMFRIFVAVLVDS